MYKSIMVPLADPVAERAALEAGVRVARASGARLHVVHVREKKNGARHDAESDALLAAADWAAEELDESVSFQLLDRPAQTTHTNSIVAALDAHAAANHIDLIVMTRRPPGLGRLLFGSVGERLLLAQDSPILFVPRNLKALPRRGWRILLALDGTSGGEVVLGPASQLARALEGSLLLLRVQTPVLQYSESPADVTAFVEEEGVYGADSAQAYLDDVATRIAASGVEARWHTLAGERVSPVLRKAATSQRAHVIALAPRTRDGSLHFALDSVTEPILRKSETALLAKRQPPPAS